MSVVDMNSLSLEDLTEEANRRYPNLTVEGVTFLNAVQMTKEQRQRFRDAVRATQDLAEEQAGVGFEDGEVPEFEEDDEAGIEAVKSVLIAAASDTAAAKILFDKIGDNAAVVLTIQTHYFDLSQVGEV